MTEKRYYLKTFNTPNGKEIWQIKDKYEERATWDVDTIIYWLNNLNDENKQLKSSIAQLIEQNSKNNESLLSDIRILEKALWCNGCENDFRRLRELRKEFIR